MSGDLTRSKDNIIENSENAPSTKFEYISSIIVSLCGFTTGYGVSWIGPSLLKFSEENIPFDESKESFLANLYQYGTVPGNIAAIYIADKFGRRNCMTFTILPFLLSNFLIYLWAANEYENVWLLYTSRFLNGFASGIVFAGLAVYMSEIASPAIRGKISNLLPAQMAIGVLAAYILIPYTSIQVNALCISVIPIVQLIGSFFVPESPYFYALKGNDKRALNSLQRLRNTNDVDEELHKIKTHMKEVKKGHLLDFMTTDIGRKSLGMALLAFFVQQSSGFPVVNTYGQKILAEAQPTFLTAANGGILIIVVSSLMPLVCHTIIESHGRRMLMVVTAIAAIVPLALLGVYFVLKNHHVSFYCHFNWLPIVCELFLNCIFGLGLVNVPFIYLGEIFPTHLKVLGGCILSMYGSMLGVIFVNLHQFVRDMFGEEYIFFFYVCVCIINAFLLHRYLLETQGKSLEEILYHLSGVTLEVEKNENVSKF